MVKENNRDDGLQPMSLPQKSSISSPSLSQNTIPEMSRRQSLAPSSVTAISQKTVEVKDGSSRLNFDQRSLANGFLTSDKSFSDFDSTQKQDSVGKPRSRDKHAAQDSPKSGYTCDEEHGLDQKIEYRPQLDLEPPRGEVTLPSISNGGQWQNGVSGSLSVTWNGPHDPSNPKNWVSKKKWAVTACIASFTFLSPLASTMIAPALPQIAEEFRITSAVEVQLVLSIFVLSFAIGPMVLGPLSELYGRVVVSQASNIVFLVFNTACGFATSKQQLMAFRFLSGLGGSAPLAIGGAVLGDIFKPEERGKAMGLYAMGPLLGPALGPIVGAWVTQKSTWRWMFWATSIVNVIIFICNFIWFEETYAPYLLRKKAGKVRKQTGNENYHAGNEAGISQTPWKKIAQTMGRAFGMLCTQPIVQVMSLYMGFSYGILYLMLSTFPTLFMQQYGESVGVSGLNYISLGLGFFIGAPICGKSSDLVYRKLKEKDPQKRGKPEFRMPLIIPFSFLVPVGLLIYGWSAQFKTHWIIPNVGAFIFSMGTIAAFQCVTTYLVDTYTLHAASAIAAVTILRSLMGFAFPLFAPYMYQALDYGWGNTVLAIAAVAIGVPVPILLWTFGERLRKASAIVGGRHNTVLGPNTDMGCPQMKGTEKIPTVVPAPVPAVLPDAKLRQ